MSDDDDYDDDGDCVDHGCDNDALFGCDCDDYVYDGDDYDAFCPPSIPG